MRNTVQVRRILERALEVPEAEWYGRQMAAVTGLGTGTVYPALNRLLAEGVLAARWEDPAEARRRRLPQRCWYRLADLDRALALVASTPAATRVSEPGPWVTAGLA